MFWLYEFQIQNSLPHDDYYKYNQMLYRKNQIYIFVLKLDCI